MITVPWHEDDTYWASVYDFFFSEKAFSQAALRVPKLMQLSGRDAGKMLDLGCGPGRFAVPFAKEGFTVTGLDRTQLLLDRGKEYAVAQGVDVEWINADMRRFVRPNTYDLVISMFTSFGYFEDINENQAVLANVFKSLVSGGVFVMDLMGKEIQAKRSVPVAIDTLPNGDLFIDRPVLVDDWQKVENEIILIIGGKVRRFPIRLWIFSARELKGMLADAGFKMIKIYGSLEGVPYGPDASRLIAVAQK